MSHRQLSLSSWCSGKASIRRSSHNGESIKGYSIFAKSEHLRAWENSGLSLRSYAASNNIPVSTFKDWKKSAEIIHEERSKKAGGGTDVKRLRTPEYYDIERELVNYLDKRVRLMCRDKVGLSWSYLQHRAEGIADRLLPADKREDFKASPGWLYDVLKRNRFVGVNLHGEANDCDPEKAEELMRVFRGEVQELMEEHDVPVARVFNGDQSGLFHQKLPNHAFC